ncbi:MAG: YbjN domain-containing protein [Hyphomicrobiales bacterium]
MSLLDLHFEDRPTHPVDVIEAFAAVHDWAFERAADDEITICVSGKWAEYHVSFSWMPEIESLHVASSFDLKTKNCRNDEVVRLLALINEQMLCGHFDLWSKEGLVIYRQSLLLAGGALPNSEQVKSMLNSALEACECYFQAFQFVLWAGSDAKEALTFVMFETEGEA